MAVNLEQIISELQPGFVPDDSAGLVVTLETLPELFKTLTEKLDELSVHAGGVGLMTISTDVLDIVRACDATRQAAEDAAVSPQTAFLSGR